MDKKWLFKLMSLCFIGVAVAGIGIYLFSRGFDATASSQNRGSDQLFNNIGIVQIPHISQAIEIQLEDVFGNTIRLSDFRGKIVFLNFWASWCPTCVAEMPSMEKLHRRLKDRDFVMIAVNLQESDAQVKAFFARFKLTFLTLLDSSGEVGSGFAVHALPTTFVIGKDGRMIGKATGPREWDSKNSIAFFEHLIN
jgi:thiol-disulfide isomerase/thioredoxin